MTGMRKKTRAEQLRQMLAQEAARVMAEQGIDDFLLAKRKAAERLGVSDAAALPKNSEIESALVDHQRLFGAGKHHINLRELRLTALNAMRLLKEFEPRLVGPVLTGVATEHSYIQLHVFAEQPEVVGWRLHEQGVPHRLNERRVRYERDRFVAYPVFSFVAGSQTVEAMVFPIDGLRQAPASPVDGRPIRRGGISEVEALVRSADAAATSTVAIN